MTIAEAFLAEFRPELDNTRKMLERVPDDTLDFRPHEKSMTMRELAGHVADMPRYGTTTVLFEEFDIDPPSGDAMTGINFASRAAGLEEFDRAAAEAVETIATASDAAMMAPWTLKKKGESLFTMPRINVLKGMVMNHMIHHRAQLGVYLRLNDVPVPGMYGPSADDR